MLVLIQHKIISQKYLDTCDTCLSFEIFLIFEAVNTVVGGACCWEIAQRFKYFHLHWPGWLLTPGAQNIYQHNPVHLSHCQSAGLAEGRRLSTRFLAFKLRMDFCSQNSTSKTSTFLQTWVFTKRCCDCQKLFIFLEKLELRVKDSSPSSLSSKFLFPNLIGIISAGVKKSWECIHTAQDHNIAPDQLCSNKKLTLFTPAVCSSLNTHFNYPAMAASQDNKDQDPSASTPSSREVQSSIQLENMSCLLLAPFHVKLKFLFALTGWQWEEF